MLLEKKQSWRIWYVSKNALFFFSTYRASEKTHLIKSLCSNKFGWRARRLAGRLAHPRPPWSCWARRPAAWAGRSGCRARGYPAFPRAPAWASFWRKDASKEFPLFCPVSRQLQFLLWSTFSFLLLDSSFSYMNTMKYFRIRFYLVNCIRSVL